MRRQERIVLAALVVAVYLGWRLVRAIKKSGDIKPKE
jgi:hypothetical protein